MEGTFPRNVHLRVIIKTSSSSSSSSSLRPINQIRNDWNSRGNPTTGYKELTYKSNDHEKPKINETKVIDIVKCRFIKNFDHFYNFIIRGSVLIIIVIIIIYLDYISMLKRSHSMEFDSEQFKTSINPHFQSDPKDKDSDDSVHYNKKMYNFDERKSPRDSNGSPETNRRAESYRRYSQTGENVHVTQSRSIFSHEDSFVYGNPKEDIKNIENHPLAGDLVGETSKFEIGLSNVLDLSCKPGKTEEEKSLAGNDSNTYQNYQRSNQFGSESTYPRSNLEIKLVNKKPSIPEQLQIAKIQQQQRRSMQQQQKFLLQMRRSLDPKSSNRHQQQQQQQQREPSHGSHKNVKYYGNNTTNHEQNDLDNHARIKEEFHPPVPSPHFPQLPYPYFDPNHPKELPDNHPILPLLDPVYFSALYNAHGFLPPSSPSIAAAFIGTLQDALPKLPMIFPSTSSPNPPLLPQKSNENPN